MVHGVSLTDMKRLFGDAGSLRRLYSFSILISVAACFGVLLGAGVSALITVLILSALEITFSFDNAIVNAKILRRMSQRWQKLFLTVGILIAVFGMRFFIPIALVAVTARLDMLSVVQLALTEPVVYAQHLTAAHAIIASFGGMFLLLIFFEFMFDAQRDIHWLRAIERPLVRIGRIRYVPVVLAVTILVIVAETFGGGQRLSILAAGLCGIAVHSCIRLLTELFVREQAAVQRHTLVRAGLVNFIYLEILDASFSFDGVIGAFAITKMVLLIAVGLGIGALWVRSMTMHMVMRDTLSKYRYLDHGAHYAIGALAAIMLATIAYDIPDTVTGLTGVLIIGLSLIDSLRYNRREQRLGISS